MKKSKEQKDKEKQDKKNEKAIRNAAHKEKRIAKFREKKLNKNKGGCRGCGEDPYCYCGSGTPGVIDY